MYFFPDRLGGGRFIELASTMTSNNIADVQDCFKTARSTLLDWVWCSAWWTCLRCWTCLAPSLHVMTYQSQATCQRYIAKLHRKATSQSYMARLPSKAAWPSYLAMLLGIATSQCYLTLLLSKVFSNALHFNALHINALHFNAQHFNLHCKFRNILNRNALFFVAGPGPADACENATIT